MPRTPLSFTLWWALGTTHCGRLTAHVSGLASITTCSIRCGSRFYKSVGDQGHGVRQPMPPRCDASAL